jgi:hypothetical protein
MSQKIRAKLLRNFCVLLGAIAVLGVFGCSSPDLRIEKDLKDLNQKSLQQDMAAEEELKRKKAMELEEKRRSGEIVLDEEAVDKNQELVKPEENNENKVVF